MHIEGLCNLYSSPYISKAMKSKIRWLGHAAGIGGISKCITNFAENPMGRDHMKDLCLCMRILLE